MAAERECPLATPLVERCARDVCQDRACLRQLQREDDELLMSGLF
jgi:hypothetical protein